LDAFPIADPLLFAAADARRLPPPLTVYLCVHIQGVDHPYCHPALRATPERDALNG